MQNDNTIPVYFTDHQLKGALQFKQYKKMVQGLSDARGDIARTKAWEKDVNAGGRVDDGESPVLGFMKDALDLIVLGSAYLVANPVDTLKYDTWFALRDMFCAAIRLSTLPGYTCPVYPDTTVHDAVCSVAETADILFRLTDPTLMKGAAPVPDKAKMQARYASIYMDIVCGRGVFWIAFIDAIGNQLAEMYGDSWADKLDEYANARFVQTVGEFMGRINCNEDVAVTAVGGAAMAAAYMFDSRQSQVASFDCPNTTEISDAVRATYEARGAREAFGDVTKPLFEMGADMRGYCRIAKVPPMGAVICMPRIASNRFRTSFLQMRDSGDKVQG